jgi:hypothetical protein
MSTARCDSSPLCLQERKRKRKSSRSISPTCITGSTRDLALPFDTHHREHASPRLAFRHASPGARVTSPMASNRSACRITTEQQRRTCLKVCTAGSLRQTSCSPPQRCPAINILCVPLFSSSATLASLQLFPISSLCVSKKKRDCLPTQNQSRTVV